MSAEVELLGSMHSTGNLVFNVVTMGPTLSSVRLDLSAASHVM